MPEKSINSLDDPLLGGSFDKSKLKRATSTNSPSMGSPSNSFNRMSSPMLMRNSSASQSFSYSQLTDGDLSLTITEMRRSNTIKGVAFCLASTLILAFSTMAWEVLFDDTGFLSDYVKTLNPDANTLVTTLAIETSLSLVVYTLARPIINRLEKLCCLDQQEREINEQKRIKQEIKEYNEEVGITTEVPKKDENDPPSVEGAEGGAPEEQQSAPVSVLRYNFLALLGAVLYFSGFCFRLIGISYLSAITFSQMEPARIVYIFVLKVMYIVCCMPSLDRAPTCLKEVAEAIAMTVLDGDEQDGTAAKKRLFRLPVIGAMALITGSLGFQMYNSLSSDGTSISNQSEAVIGFTSLFVCLLFNACENVWWEIVALHPDIETLSFLQRHDQYLLVIAGSWTLIVMAVKGLWFQDVFLTMLIAGGLNSLTVPGANALESMSLEKIDSITFSSIQELCYPFFTLLFAVCVYGSNTSLPDFDSWVAMAGLALGIIFFHLTQTFCTKCGTLTNDDEEEDDKLNPKSGSNENSQIGPNLSLPSTIPEGEDEPFSKHLNKPLLSNSPAKASSHTTGIFARLSAHVNHNDHQKQIQTHAQPHHYKPIAVVSDKYDVQTSPRSINSQETPEDKEIINIISRSPK